MANPFAEDTFCNRVFGYPPKAIAQILAIEDDLPIRPADLGEDEVSFKFEWVGEFESYFREPNP